MIIKDAIVGRTEALLRELGKVAGRPLSIQALMEKARIHPGERTAVKRLLRELVREGKVARDGKRFSVAAASGDGAAGLSGSKTRAPALVSSQRPRFGCGILGTLSKHRDGFGFVSRLDRSGEDIFLPPGEAARALDGDLVRVEIVKGHRGRSSGRILEMVERRRRLLVGTYFARGSASFVVPSDRGIEGTVRVEESTLAEEGELVKVAISPEGEGLFGTLVERIGDPGDPKNKTLEVAYAKGFVDTFPESVKEQAAAVPDHVGSEDRKGRRDLRRLRLVTIDGEDARDFDDAVFVERVALSAGGRGYRLVVAIADVAHYVPARTPLDAEALRRGTSVYFPMQVLPMLPERLSNGICSLNPDVDRLCMVADMLIDGAGVVRSAEVYEGVMRSAARCTYGEVARILAGERVPQREMLRGELELMAELQEKLTAVRASRGSIDFDLPEAQIVIDSAGLVTAIDRRPRNRAHRVVEEFMLAANEAVARWFGERKLGTIYRIHGVPDEEKLEAFRSLAHAHGFDVPEGSLSPGALNALLEQLEGHPQSRALNQLLLRAMMQATYSPENIGHYGLAAEHYLHFTSPIRRYPDLMVHRLLKQEWARRSGTTKEKPVSDWDLSNAAAISSERERAAVQAEREVAAYYAAVFMQEKVGERFRGVVSAVVEFGMFVELERWFVEGLVPIEDLGAGFAFDEKTHALRAPASGRAFRIGDPVVVDVLSASPARRQITLGLVVDGQDKNVVRGRSTGREQKKKAGRPGSGRRTGQRHRPAKPSGRQNRGGRRSR